MPHTPDDIPSVSPAPPRALPVYYPPPPRRGGGFFRALLVLLLFGSLALNILLLCGGLLIRGIGVSESDYSALPVHEKFLGGTQSAAEKVAVGTSCMGPPDSGNFTPLDDVVKLCQWEPESGHKKRAMLYTFSYDIEKRAKGGTGYPDGTFTETIHQNLP